MVELVFLKLGGSLITDKTLPYTPRLDKLADLAAQIFAAKQAQPGLSLVLGHGSGSFGHTAAREYKTREGNPHRPSGTAPESTRRNSPKSALLASGHPPIFDEVQSKMGGAEGGGGYWFGFAEVWFQASALNRFVMDSLHSAGVPSLALAPVSAVTASNGKVSSWDLTPLKAALAAGLVPVIYGDVIFDTLRGGTILSTEDLFAHLARELHPQRILLAGLEGAVWADFPERQQRVEKITPASFDEVKARVGASHGADVTGGMESKVRQMLALVTEIPDLTAQIFSGETPGNLQRVLNGEISGTEIQLD
jgi:isopentenyl phosphate kinase